jgi:uncharacterized protein YqjF (DUF2071 family)
VFHSALTSRISSRHSGLIDVRSDLLHFALITYALPAERLRPYIPPRFDIPTFPVQGRQLSLMSAVPFLDADFHFYRLTPFIKWRFAQTNYRVYVVDRETGEHCAWFFGTTLGSWVVNIARTLWRIPWHYARYEMDCQYNPARRAYDSYKYTIHSDWASAEIDLEDTGEAMPLTSGFAALDEQILILTHPIVGHFYRLDSNSGTYSVWHEEIPLTSANPKNLYFSLYERLGLLSREEMQNPHSVLICPRTTFEVHLPPRRIS